MKLTKRQLKRIIAESVYSSKNMQRQSYSHDKFLDRQREKEYRKSDAYYDKEMTENAVDFLSICTEQPVDEEEIDYYRESLSADDIQYIVEIYEEVIQKLRSFQ